MVKLLRPVAQASCDFQDWLHDNQNKLEGMDTEDMLFEIWLAARGLGGENHGKIHCQS